MKHLFVAIMLLYGADLLAQETLIFVDGKELMVNVQEITDSEVKYKLIGDEMLRSTSRTKLFVLKYADGKVEPLQLQENRENQSSGGNSTTNNREISIERDKWGRTYEENMRLYKKRLVTGSVLSGIGVAFLGGGGIAWVLNPTLDVPVGPVLMGAGGVFIFIGVLNIAAFPKYKKRANQLAMGGLSLSPAIMNMHSYSGTSIHGSAGYGLVFNYEF